MSQNRVVATAVAATAASTLILSGILFYLFYRFTMARQRERDKHNSSFRRETTPPLVSDEEFMQNGGTLRGLIVEENGRDILYLRKPEGGRFTTGFSKVWFNPINEEEKEMDDKGLKPSSICNCCPNQEIPLLPRELHHHAINIPDGQIDIKPMQLVNHPPKQASRPSHFAPPPPPLVIPPEQSPPPPLPPPPPPPPPPPLVRRTRPLSPPQRPPPPLPAKEGFSKPPAPPRPPPPPAAKRISKSPAAPPIPSKTKPESLLLPPTPSALLSSFQPPAPRKSTSSHNRAETSFPENSTDHKGDVHQMKLKPLHWDKVTTNADHSMVWHEINDGSLRFDEKLMEALFGYSAPNNKSTEGRNIYSSNSSATSSPAQPRIFILDPRKSQNTAIILKSLAISRREILDALQEGHGLRADHLEKLSKISPTPEDVAKILKFDGNPAKLADAESFLYHILKAIPSAFMRINAMLFRSSYDPDILHLKESLQTLELSSKELRTRGIFLKLLEAILKAGNRMNFGTARGNAQGFNLSTLRKLSYVKSTDGKTTLLHFVVEQVIRSEGKRCATNNTRNNRIGSGSGSGSSNSGTISNTTCKDDEDLDSKTTKDDVDKEYLMLGLPVVWGLSTEFSYVKKAATIDYENFIRTCPTLTKRITDIRQLVSHCGSSNERSGFMREMKGFLEECEEELKIVREEQARVMQLVQRTKEYYQAGASKDKGTDPLQLFGIVKDFLSMVDHVCIDISKKLQKKPLAITSAGSSPPLPQSPKTANKFKNLQSYFASQKPGTLSSESEDDF